MDTREAMMEWWWLPMIPCAMATRRRRRLRQPRSLARSPPAGKEENTVESRLAAREPGREEAAGG